MTGKIIILFLIALLAIAAAGCATTGGRISYWEREEKTGHLIEALEDENRIVSHRAAAALIRLCDRKIESEPDFAAAYHLRGLAYKRMGEYDSALADYNRAIGIDPEFSMAIHNRGVFYDYISRQYDKAIADYERYLEIVPQAENAARVRRRIGFLKHEIAGTRFPPGGFEDSFTESSWRAWGEYDQAYSAPPDVTGDLGGPHIYTFPTPSPPVSPMQGEPGGPHTYPPPPPPPPMPPMPGAPGGPQPYQPPMPHPPPHR